MSAALHALLLRSCQLADLDAIVARANERLAELRTRKPYPRARGGGAGRAAGTGGEGEECGDAGGRVMGGFGNYDSWKLASPYDTNACDAEICDKCGGFLERSWPSTRETAM